MTVVRRKEAASFGPAAGNVDQPQAYVNCGCVSRPNLLAQAAEVLCLLSFFSVSPPERAGFSALLERRIERAYPGVSG